MKKNGRTFKEDIRIVLKGIREFDNILPGQMKILAVKSAFATILPYIEIIASALIISELTGAHNYRKLLIFVIAAVGATFMLSGILHVLEAKLSVGFSRLFSTHELRLTHKSCVVPYHVLESKAFQDEREQVSGNMNVSGGGMASLYWDIEVVISSLFTTFMSVIVFVYFVVILCLKVSTGVISVTKTVSILTLLFILIAVCSYISCKLASRRFDVIYDVFKNGAKYKRYGDYYMQNYLPDEDLALDVRIFRQKELILRESQEKCYDFFAKGKAKEMQAVSINDGIQLACTGLCGIVVYAIIGYLALINVVGIGSVIMLYSAVTMLIASFSRMAEIFTDLRNNNVHLLKYFEYMGHEENTNVCENKQNYDTKDDMKLTLENVSFHYPDLDLPVLKNINLSIKSGEKLAIVGENGSGKTTLVKLICRLYRPDSGRILLNGRDIWEYPYEDYIKKISTVFQDFSLFAFSIAENVAASCDYDKDRVLASLKRAGLGNKIDSLDKGIEQSLYHHYDENGTDLSGGEEQKMAIARAIYKEAPTVILDEPTAALDPYAEKEIYKQFFRNLTSETMISISHRLSSCRYCNRIIVLDSGRIVQNGTHEELLMQNNGKYFVLWNAQAQYYNE